MKVGIVGSGAMGSGIAQVAAAAGHEVLVYDTNPVALKRAQEKLQKILNRLVEKGRITDAEAKATFGNVYYVESLYGFSDRDLVIEAIIEKIEVKRSVFEQLETLVSETCVLASNTSSLSITSIAGGCQHPKRVLGIHFFNPAPLMKLVEIIPAMQTNPDILAKAQGWIDNWGKLTVRAKDTPGFIVNRVARPFYSEALRINEEGIADFATIDWAMTEIAGFRMGPFTLMDFIGNDVNYAVTESVWTSFFYDPRYKPAFAQKRLTEAGWLGRKSGRGYFNYDEKAEKAAPNTDRIIGQQIVDRIVAMLINEAADAVHLNIASPKDIETAMTKGVNYPKGLLHWADEIGIQTVVNRLDDLYNDYHEDRYRCSVLLRRMAKAGTSFFQ